jgi:hypothetical protein
MISVNAWLVTLNSVRLSTHYLQWGQIGDLINDKFFIGFDIL